MMRKLTTGFVTAALVAAVAVLSMGQIDSAPRITILDEGVTQGRVRSVDFTGAGVSATVSGATGTVDITGGGGGGHTIQDEGGSLAARTNLNFVGGGVTCTDDAGNNQTDCTIPADAAHNLLSATHSDTSAASVVRGDILVGNSTPAWSRLGIGGFGAVPWSDGTDIINKFSSFMGGFVNPTFTTSSTSYVDVTGLTVALPANAIFAFTCFGTYSTNATTTGIGFSINGTGGTGQSAIYSLSWQTTALNTSGNNTGSTDAFTERNEVLFDSMSATTSVVATGNLIWKMVGFYYTGSSGTSTFAIRTRSELIAPATASINFGSYCLFTRQV